MARVGQGRHRFVTVAALVLAHGLIVIIAGHGIGPIALLMVFGSASAWLSGQLLGWLGAILLLPALLVRSEPAQVSLRVWGAGLLLLSAAAFIAHSEARVVSSLTAQALMAIALQPTREAAVAAALLVLDIAILVLLFSRPASAWLGSRPG
jgi:hypothetical protein